MYGQHNLAVLTILILFLACFVGMLAMVRRANRQSTQERRKSLERLHTVHYR